MPSLSFTRAFGQRLIVKHDCNPDEPSKIAEFVTSWQRISIPGRAGPQIKLDHRLGEALSRKFERYGDSGLLIQ
jgi:hypothetical protein